MNDAEHEDDAVPVEKVVHDPVVADPQPVEGIVHAANRLYGLPFDASDLRRVTRKLLERPSDPSANLGVELPERLLRRGAELDAIRVQVRSDRVTVRPSAYAARASRRIRTYSSALANTRSWASSTGINTAAGRPRFVTTYAAPASTRSMTAEAVAFNSLTPISAMVTYRLGGHLDDHLTLGSLILQAASVAW